MSGASPAVETEIRVKRLPPQFDIAVVAAMVAVATISIRKPDRSWQSALGTFALTDYVPNMTLLVTASTSKVTRLTSAHIDALPGRRVPGRGQMSMEAPPRRRATGETAGLLQPISTRGRAGAPLHM